MADNLALSIRQPWAHLIIFACKDIENRTWPTRVRGRVFIHAAKEMTVSEYQGAELFCREIHDHLPSDFTFPAFDSLKRGGIIGAMHIADCVTVHPSAWFQGPFGFVIDGAGELPFQPCAGKLGFFKVC